MDVITKKKNRKIKKLMEEMEKLVEKADYLENMNEKLFTQTQNQLEDLLECQAMDVRRPNFIFEKLVCFRVEKVSEKVVSIPMFHMRTCYFDPNNNHVPN
jgi:uncharacterized protein YigA (DUF484 family)